MAILDVLLGKPLPSGEDADQKVGVLKGVPTYGVDALASAAYGPEAALTILIPAAAAGLAWIMPLSLGIIGLLTVVFFSYRQTIAAYPNGGGSYTVARENLGQGWGVLAGAALMLDYLLDVGVGISAGVGALVSAVPKLQTHTLGLCLGILLILTLVNLRGAGESGTVFLVPTYLFIGCLLTVIGWGIGKELMSGGQPQAVVAPPRAAGHAAIHAMGAVGAWLVIRAFASGCTALTGVEAVSNGVKAFKDPSAPTAQLTLGVTVATLSVLMAGVAHLTRVYGIVATTPGSPHYQSLLSMLTAAVAGKGWFYYVTMGSVLVLLSLSANTAFAGFPRLCRVIAENGYLPSFFAIQGRRLVYTEGIVVLAVLAGAILVVFDGVTDRLIPLFAIGAFIAFTLSQGGMVMHWIRTGGARSRWYMTVNGVGAVATGVTVALVLVAKFKEGAWITVVIIPLVMLLMHGVQRHYARVADEAKVERLEVAKDTVPVAVLPVMEWNRASQAALQFAVTMTRDVHVLHIDVRQEEEDEQCGKDACEKLQAQMDDAVRGAGFELPKMVTVSSPYRFVIAPIVEYVLELERQMPERKLAVIVPEFVVAHWYQNLLHNHRSTALKAELLIKGSRRIVVVNVPWYLR